MALFSKFLSKLRGGTTAAADWDELRVTLIGADLGANLSDELIARAKREKAENIEVSLTTILRSVLTDMPRTLTTAIGRPTSVIVVGVNGTGKTTSVAKLMHVIKRSGDTVIVAAGDTFRAAAVEQLQTWGERADVDVVVGKFQGDPASVVYDALTRAKSADIQYLIVDTAGRLHTKLNLMDELTKIRRVLEKSSPVDEVLLVVDATTGQNGIVQAKSFIEAVGVTGLILTKMDGSAKGGIALAIEHETGIPIKFVGTGEGINDFSAFDPERYVLGLLS